MICDKYFRLYDKSGKGTELVFEEIEPPVKHGRWGHDFYDDGEGGENWFRFCSECEVEVSEENAKLWRYCPYCGAQMEENDG